MAAISVSISRGSSDNDLGVAGAQTVTAATNAPGAGDVEIRFSSASLAAGLTVREAEELIEILWRFVSDNTRNASLWPNI